jgi:hypothetical protein
MVWTPPSVPKVQRLRAKLALDTTGPMNHENAVFSHLLAFFSRYYDNGDFISQRRYKGDTYAIPYAGEEVMLHWANKDQYYTKSGENFQPTTASSSKMAARSISAWWPRIPPKTTARTTTRSAALPHRAQNGDPHRRAGRHV